MLRIFCILKNCIPFLEKQRQSRIISKESFISGVDAYTSCGKEEHNKYKYSFDKIILCEKYKKHRILL